MIAQDQLRARMAYNPETGSFTAKIASGRRKAGAELGYVKSDGYPRSSCAVCGPIIRRNFKCAEGYNETETVKMNMKPSKVVYDIGKDRYGRRTRLVGEVDGGQQFWAIISDPIAQRDEGEHIRSLTADQLRAIGKALS